MLSELSTSKSLIRRVQRRETDAWEMFARLYGPLVYAWVRRFGVAESDAADVCQTVFVGLLQRLDQFAYETPASSFRSWLKTVTRNEVRQFWRRRNQQDATTQDATILAQQVEDAAMPEDDPESDITESQQLARRAMELIRPEYEPQTWQAFWRVVIDGQSAVAVAEELQLTAGAVRQAKFRILCRLREILDDVSFGKDGPPA